MVVLFVNLGLWQLGRHDDRQADNALIEDRRARSPLLIDEAADLDGVAPSELAHRLAVVTGSYLDPDFVRVFNRSQAGSAGEYVVAIVELVDGTKLAVNRGFVPSNADVELAGVPGGSVDITGQLLESVERGRFGVEDSGEGSKVPRVNIDDLARRLGEDLPPVWLQIEAQGADGAAFPDPVPVPALDAGPHLSYAVQWFIFATLGSLFYGALLWRQSRSDRPRRSGAPLPEIKVYHDGP